MNKFNVISKLWPSGALLPGGLDTNPVNPPGGTFERTAPPIAAGPGAPNGYRFLFWNTGVRVTNKFKVTWTFSHLSTWTIWTATRWYGVAGSDIGDGPGSMTITATAFSMEDDASMPGSPIAAASTFTDGPGGQKAHPFGNPPNEQVASTQWGPASVVAVDPFPYLVFKQYLFAGWLALILGGDETGQFDESDGPAVGGGGGSGAYSNLTPNPAIVDQEATVELLAAYRAVRVPPVHHGPLERITFVEWLLEYDRLVDPRPGFHRDTIDLLRIGALAELFAMEGRRDVPPRPPDSRRP